MHAVGVGHERLTEEHALDQRLELELEKILFEIMDNVGLLKTDPSVWLAEQPEGLLAASSSPGSRSRRSSPRSSRRHVLLARPD